MTPPRLEQPPEHETLKTLREKGLLTPEDFWKGIRALNRPDDWTHWAYRFCLLIGSALLLAAVVYFFAFNWDALSRWQKLGILQAGTLGVLIGGQVIGFNRLGGQLLLMAASVFVGVSFAVFGQVYQTGADAFGFFGMWALCISPWVLAGAFAPLWTLWFALVNLTAYFFWDQVGQFHDKINYTYLCLLITAINGSGLILRERLAPKAQWLQGVWIRPLFVSGTVIPLLIPALSLILDARPSDPYSLLLGTCLWVVCLGFTHVYFTRKDFDSTAVCIVLGNVATYLVVGISRVLDELDAYDDGGGFLLMALIIGGITTLLVKTLRRLKQRYATGKDPSL